MYFTHKCEGFPICAYLIVDEPLIIISGIFVILHICNHDLTSTCLLNTIYNVKFCSQYTSSGGHAYPQNVLIGCCYEIDKSRKWEPSKSSG
jgi:hypothetical protein